MPNNRDDEPLARWTHVRLDEVAEVQTGIAKNASATSEAAVDVPYLRVANVQDGYVDLRDLKTLRVDRTAVDRYLLRDGDVLLTEGGDFDKLGRGCVWELQVAPCIHQNHVFAVRTTQARLLPRFLAHYAASPPGKAYFLGCAKQTTNLASINSSQLKAMPLPLPPMGEQRKITAIISSVDDAIEATQAVLDQIQIVKKAMMTALLTRGIPGRHTKFKMTEIGEVPEEWELGFVEDFSQIKTGDRDTQDRVRDGAYPFIVRSQTVERIDSYSFDGEAVLTAGDGVGTGKVFHYLTGRFDYHQRVYNIHNFSPNVLGKFFFFYFQLRFIDQVRKYSAKNSVDSVRRAMIARMVVPIPPVPEQREIAVALSALDLRLATELEVLAALRMTKSALMSVLLTGQVRVKSDEESAA